MDAGATWRLRNRLPCVNEPEREPLPESEVSWQVRLARSRAVAWLELCRPHAATLLLLSSALMVLTAAEGSLFWALPLQYGAMVVALSCAAGLLGNALDAEIDGKSRLMRPIPAGKMETRSVLLAATIPTATGAAIGFSTDWRVGIIGLAMLGASVMYNVGWRGSILGFASFALVGVLMPVGAIQTADVSLADAHLLWVIPVGALTGAATFLIYKLPDLSSTTSMGHVQSSMRWGSTLPFRCPGQSSRGDLPWPRPRSTSPAETSPGC